MSLSMSLDVATFLVIVVVGAAFIAGLVDASGYWAILALWMAAIAVSSAAEGDYFGASARAAAGVWFAFFWWKNRRNGRWKKAARELGEKSKARVQALVEQMTPSPIPSPAGCGS